jgi:sec-independent protein translocase protein TatA
MNMLAFGTPGPSEWMLILIIVLVLFGAKKLPELARGVGQSLNEFRKVRDEFDRELQEAANHVKGQPAPGARATRPVPAPSVQAATGSQPVLPQDPAQGTDQANGSGHQEGASA